MITSQSGIKGILFLAIGLISFSFQGAAHGREGFSDPQKLDNAKVKSAAASVFMLSRNDSGAASFGTAFLVAKVKENRTTRYYFLTAGHSVPGLCKRHEVGECYGVTLYFNTRVQEDENRIFNRTSRDNWNFGSDYFTGLRIEAFRHSDTEDFALLSILKSNDSIKAEPLKIAKQCAFGEGETLYTLGNPMLQVRYKHTSDKPGLETEDLRYVSLRASTGVSVLYPADNTRIYSTTDALGGNSGGPLLNTNGDVVGLMIRSRKTYPAIPFTDEEISAQFRQTHRPSGVTFESVAESCSTPQSFLSSALGSLAISP